jgi:hypothetical protein
LKLPTFEGPVNGIANKAEKNYFHRILMERKLDSLLNVNSVNYKNEQLVYTYNYCSFSRVFKKISQVNGAMKIADCADLVSSPYGMKNTCISGTVGNVIAASADYFFQTKGLSHHESYD